MFAAVFSLLQSPREFHVECYAYAHVARKGQHDFTKCATCTQLEDQFKSAKGKREMEQVILLRKQHDGRVSAERSAYHKMRERAQRDPEEYTVMIVDGMDQAKTAVPRMVKDKDLAKLNRIHVHLTGVLLHTDAPDGRIPYIYMDVKEVPHDSNLTLNIILNTLLDNKDRLGRVLFLQLDNCFRENKNKFLLSLASLLVEKKVFEEVIVHFLPVGHTHEDVDQMFSRISCVLKGREAVFTIVDLGGVIREAYTPTIEVKYATPLFNIKDWITPHMAGRFHNHSFPLWFRFRVKDGKTRMHYKMWVTDQWLPEEQLGEDGVTVEEHSKGLICLQSIPDISQPPEWVIPTLLKLDVEAIQRELPMAYKHRMPEEKRQWWQEYVSNLDQLTQVPPPPNTWPLLELANRVSPEPPVWELPPQLEQIRDLIHTECRTITVGMQGRHNPKAVQHVDDYDKLSEGDLAVVNIEPPPPDEEPPFIGKVMEVKEDEVTLHWMRGGYNKTWKEWFDGCGRSRRPRCQQVPLQSIMLFGFPLTKKGNLRKDTMFTIQKLYAEK